MGENITWFETAAAWPRNNNNTWSNAILLAEVGFIVALGAFYAYTAVRLVVIRHRGYVPAAT